MVGAAACGGGGDDDDDAVASLGADESAEADGGGNEDQSGGGGETPRDSQEFQDAALEYAQCMRDNGIDMPDPEFDGEGGVAISAGPGGPGGPGEGGPDDEEFQAADEECHPIIEEAAPDMQLDPEEQAERQDQMVEVAQCMRDRGHDMPDPEVDENGRVTMQAGAGQDTGPAPGSGEEDEFESDMTECQEEAGMEIPRGGSGGSTSEVED